MSFYTDDDYEKMTPDQLDLLANRETRVFYELLERKCKRFQPDHFIPKVIEITRNLISKGKFLYAPPHQVALMIEAVCTYSRKQNNDPLDYNRYAEIKNLFHERRDPASVASIRRGIDWFILAMQREQIELQRNHSVYDISNATDLYKDPKLAAEMKTELGMSPERWISVCLGVWSTVCKPETIIVKPTIREPDLSKIKLTEDELKHIFTRMSRAPIEIAKRYRKLRNETSPKFHSHIRSTLIDRPFIQLNGSYCAPIPGVAFRALFAELYNTAKDCNSFDPAFSFAMEDIVKQTAELIPGFQKIWSNKDLEKSSSDKSCDFVVETNSCNIFIECKATSFTRNVVIPEVIKDDGSTRKLQKAHIQINRTCADYMNDGINGLVTQRDVPNVGIVVTFGDIPFSNAPWYYESFLKEIIEKKVNEDALCNFTGRGIPFSLSLEMFQVLVVYLRDSGLDLLQAVNKYCAKSYTETGDWDAFLANELEGSEKDSGLPFVKINSDRAFSRIVDLPGS